MRQPRLGIAAIGHSLAMAHTTTTAKHAIKRVDRFLGNTGLDLEVACGDLIDNDRDRSRTHRLSHLGLERTEDQGRDIPNPEYQLV